MILTIYILGCMVCYGFVYGSVVKTTNESGNPLDNMNPKWFWLFALIMASFSWVGFLGNWLIMWSRQLDFGFKLGVTGK